MRYRTDREISYNVHQSTHSDWVGALAHDRALALALPISSEIKSMSKSKKPSPLLDCLLSCGLLSSQAQATNEGRRGSHHAGGSLSCSILPLGFDSYP